MDLGNEVGPPTRVLGTLSPDEQVIYLVIKGYLIHQAAMDKHSFEGELANIESISPLHRFCSQAPIFSWLAEKEL